MPNNNNNQFQQGDVLFERVQGIPAGARPVEGTTLAEGEGHHVHRFACAGDVTIYVKDGVKYARVRRATSVEHVRRDGARGEHNPITLPAGAYRVGQVYEYDYLQEMARRVID